jgi:hypothetical protein
VEVIPNNSVSMGTIENEAVVEDFDEPPANNIPQRGRQRD